MKKHSKFFTDSEGRVRYIGNDRKAKNEDSVQIGGPETAPQRGEKGQFITKDGKVIFIGGPGGGGGSSGGTPSGPASGFSAATTASVSEQSRGLLDEGALSAPEVGKGWTTSGAGRYDLRGKTRNGDKIEGKVLLGPDSYSARFNVYRSSGTPGVWRNLGQFASPVDAMVAIQTASGIQNL